MLKLIQYQEIIFTDFGQLRRGGGDLNITKYNTIYFFVNIEWNMTYTFLN